MTLASAPSARFLKIGLAPEIDKILALLAMQPDESADSELISL